MKFLRLQHFTINPRHIVYIKTLPQQYNIVMNATRHQAVSVVGCGLMDSDSVHILVKQDTNSEDYETVSQWIDDVSPAMQRSPAEKPTTYTLGDLNNL